MQRGLRVCPQEALLWGEYLRMELLYAAKLQTRRQVLGLEPADGATLLQSSMRSVHVPREAVATDACLVECWVLDAGWRVCLEWAAAGGGGRIPVWCMC